MFQTSYRRFLLSGSSRLLQFAHAPAFASSTTIQTAHFSSNAKEEASNIRKQLWEFYLSTGRGANALFEAIDMDEKGAVDPKHLMKFMEEVLPDDVEPKEIMPYAWNRLEQRAAAGQDYDARHFKKWLVAATKMSADMKGSRLKGLYSQDPQGLGCNNVAVEEEEEATYTWNEETMSQSLRRMQYAVRGEVVMKADQLAASGREILYTNIGNPHQVRLYTNETILSFTSAHSVVSLNNPCFHHRSHLLHTGRTATHYILSAGFEPVRLAGRVWSRPSQGP